jgi:hypothetical protein
MHYMILYLTCYTLKQLHSPSIYIYIHTGTEPGSFMGGDKSKNYFFFVWLLGFFFFFFFWAMCNELVLFFYFFSSFYNDELSLKLCHIL